MRQQDGDEAAIIHYDYVIPSYVPVHARIRRRRYTDHAEGGFQSTRDPDGMILESDGDQQHQEASVRGVGKCDLASSSAVQARSASGAVLAMCGSHGNALGDEASTRGGAMQGCAVLPRFHGAFPQDMVFSLQMG